MVRELWIVWICFLELGCLLINNKSCKNFLLLDFFKDICIKFLVKWDGLLVFCCWIEREELIICNVLKIFLFI